MFCQFLEIHLHDGHRHNKFRTMSLSEKECTFIIFPIKNGYAIGDSIAISRRTHILCQFGWLLNRIKSH